LPPAAAQAHFDYFHDTLNTQNGGQRVATLLMYLCVALGRCMHLACAELGVVMRSQVGCG
jgi:hypothetical protein